MKEYPEGGSPHGIVEIGVAHHRPGVDVVVNRVSGDAPSDEVKVEQRREDREHQHDLTRAETPVGGGLNPEADQKAQSEKGFAHEERRGRRLQGRREDRHPSRHHDQHEIDEEDRAHSRDERPPAAPVGDVPVHGPGVYAPGGNPSMNIGI